MNSASGSVVLTACPVATAVVSDAVSTGGGRSGSEIDGVVGTDGSSALLADQLRASLGVDGAGVKVGVLSDSFNLLGGAAADEADGDLPATGVQVLQEGPSGADEGRAMLELIHQIAPGASLAFHTATAGLAD